MKTDIAQIESIDIILRKLLVWLERTTGLEFTITRPFRMNDNGVHGQ